uniref:Uncharacterized protein n=2 Tax=Ciona intestinalis TaxID=7719 RepID=H2XTE5_CIOIN
MKVGLWFLTLAADFIIRESQAVPSSTEEGSWSKCSVTCGEGYQTKQQTLNKFTFGEIKNQTIRRSCNLQVCPSYLGWPRIHFYGTFVANCPTTNNFRCFFNNDKFCPVCNTFRLTTATEVKFHQAGPTVHRYGFQRGSADPMGNGHFYFDGAKVTSACWKPGQACLTKDPIVGRKVTDKNTGRMV